MSNHTFNNINFYMVLWIIICYNMDNNSIGGGVMEHKTYIKESDGKRVVVFIHGFLGSPNHFKRFYPYVPDNTAIYNILLEGHGKSVRDFANASMVKWKKQVSDVIDEVALKHDEIFIAAHSMGTFFAMEEAIKRQDKVKSIYLLATPLKVCVKPVAFFNTLKSFFKFHTSKDNTAVAYKNAHSIKLTMRIWEYIGWIPRYLELFSESKKARNTVLELKTPCVVIQSEKDELVSMKSVKILEKNKNLDIRVLKHSSHFIYTEKDEKIMNDLFKNFINVAKDL